MAGMEILEGKQSVLAALAARLRRFQVVLINHGLHEEKVREVVAAAEGLGVPIKRVTGSELNELAHGATHGGVLAVCGAKPKTSVEELVQILGKADSAPLLLLIEGVEDARNLGFTLRSAEALALMGF